MLSCPMQQAVEKVSGTQRFRMKRGDLADGGMAGKRQPARLQETAHARLRQGDGGCRQCVCAVTEEAEWCGVEHGRRAGSHGQGSGCWARDPAHEDALGTRMRGPLIASA